MDTMTPQALVTARLDLEPLRVAHAEEMAGVLADPALYAFTGGEPLDAVALRARYARLVAGSPEPGVGWLNWVVRARAEGRLAGCVQATVTGRRAEVAWVVGSAWQGRGIATEAARALVGWLEGRAVREVVAHVHPAHGASAAVAAAAGLVATDEWSDGEVRWRLRFPTAGPAGTVLPGPQTPFGASSRLGHKWTASDRNSHDVGHSTNQGA